MYMHVHIALKYHPLGQKKNLIFKRMVGLHTNKSGPALQGFGSERYNFRNWSSLSLNLRHCIIYFKYLTYFPRKFEVQMGL